uniref:Predicted protein n=1 Tax=Physcomitrium patens TaxID=3218 RepID=A9U5D2_PHYPA
MEVGQWQQISGMQAPCASRDGHPKLPMLMMEEIPRHSSTSKHENSVHLILGTVTQIVTCSDVNISSLINSNLDDSVLVFASHEEDVPFHPGCCMELADYSIGKRMENAS